MEYRRKIQRIIAMVLAVSLILTNGTAVSGVVYASDKGGENTISGNDVSGNTQIPEEQTSQASEEPEVLEDAVKDVYESYGTVTQSGNCGINGGDNLTWEFYADTRTLVISGTGAMQNYGTAPWKGLDFAHLVIEEGVTTIGNFGFYDCVNLEGNIVFPKTLTSIGSQAFGGDENIRAVIFDDGETELTLGDYAFRNCKLLEELHLPRELVDYTFNSGNGPYSGCASLRELTVPGKLRDGKIEINMFNSIPNLEKLTIEEGITTIGRNAFSVTYLMEVNLPDSLTEIPDSMFYCAERLARINAEEGGNQINIPVGVERIGTHAFYYCTALGTVGEGEYQGRIVLPQGLKEIGSYAFRGDKNIRKVIFDDDETELTLGNYVFYECVSLEELHLPQELVDYTFNAGYPPYSGCASLRELTVPGRLRDGKIEINMFNSIPNLEKLTIEEGITTIGRNAFSVTYLMEVNLPDSLTEIPDSMFYCAERLARINAEEGGNQINIPVGVERIGTHAFYYCTALGTVGEGEYQGRIVLPQGLKEIGSYAFRGDKNIRKVIFDDGETELTLGSQAFLDCASLEELHLPQELVDYTFDSRYPPYSGCTSLRELTVPGKLRDGKVGDHMFNSIPNLEKLTIEEGITTIGRNAFLVTNLTEVNLPDSLKEIPDNMFNNAAKLVRINAKEGGSQINIPAGVERIGTYAFLNCYGLTGDLRLPDSLRNIGTNAVRQTGFTTIHTPVKPVCVQEAYNSYSFDAIWFRGEDDRDTVVIDEKTYGWQTFFKEFTQGCTPKLYIDDTAKHLTSQEFWGKFKDVTFVGPNVITMDRAGKDIFSSTEMPLAGLDGTYYVTEEGVLYALDPVSGTAALAYCPPGITELYIPDTISVAPQLPEEGRYVRTYKVVSVLQHSVLQAKQLTSITASNPQQITLAMRAFADCPSLVSVNGVTTQREANALFGAYGTLAVKKAFVNTGLTADEDPSGGMTGGLPLRTLTYTDPNAGKLTISVNDGNSLKYEEGAYRLLTGEGVTFDLRAESYGKGDLQTPFRVYFIPSEQSVKGFRTQQQTITFTSGGQEYTTQVTTSFDNIIGCYCVSFTLPAGVTWVWQGAAGSENKSVTYPGRTRGGDICVWGEVLPATNAPEDDSEITELPGSINYMMLNWSTVRNLYEMEMVDSEWQAAINSNTHKPEIRAYSVPVQSLLRNGEITNRSNSIGKDPVTEIQYQYTITLPKGLVWKEEEKISIAAGGRVIEVSEDRRVLKYEVKYSASDTGAYITGRRYVLNLGNGASDNSSYIAMDTFDYCQESEISLTCTGTVYYQFSEPDPMQEVAGRIVIKPVQGSVMLERGYRFDSERGRGLPVTNFFKARNQSGDKVTVDLDTITDEVVNVNGYMYLSAQQIAELILDANPYIKASRIEISEAVLYEGNFRTGITHTGSDGNSVVYENRLNTYSEPKSERAKLLFEVVRDEADAEQPVKINFSIDGGSSESLAFSENVSELEEEIRRVLEEVGYVVPTGLYKITWQATDTMRATEIDSWGDWEIGSYHATIKLDYEQTHHWVTGDSDSGFHIIYPNEIAKAVFTVNDRTNNSKYNVEHGTYDSYPSSRIWLTVQWYNTLTQQFETGIGGQNGLNPGIVLFYTDEYTNNNGVDYEDLPFTQVIDSTQCLLAPCDRNTGLGEAFEKLTFLGEEYYMLKPNDTVQELNGVWLGCDVDSCFYAETITLGRRGSADGVDEGEPTTVRWYEKTIKKNTKIDYKFYTYVLNPPREGDTPNTSCIVYANGYKSKKYSTRLYARQIGSYRGEMINKSMIANPDKAGTPEEKVLEIRSSYIGMGQVTYRLDFDEYWITDYTLEAGRIYDILPNTSGQFAWELGKNVHIKYALRSRSGDKGYEELIPGGEGGEESFCKIEKRMWRSSTGEEKELDCLTWGSLVIPPDKTLYIYVTLDFPSDAQVWESFVDVADTILYNTFCFDRGNGELSQSSISHKIARPTQAFLKIGMYGTDSDSYGYIYPNSDETERTVKYYLVIYNHGKSSMCLNPVHIKVPDGFTLKAPPKYNYWGEDEWNCYDVTVTDENAPNRIGRQSVSGVTKESRADGKELILNIHLGSTGRWNPLVQKYYLEPGEYVAVEVKFGIDGYQFTEDTVELAAAMPIDDSFHVGRITEVSGVDAHRSSYQNSNEGIPEFWESDEMAQSHGFALTEPSDTGKWVAGSVTLKREEAKPGVIKNVPVAQKLGDVVEDYDPQEGAAMEYLIKWETKLVNGGRNSLTGYQVKEAIQWPYVFDGEVMLATQDKGVNYSFEISRFYSRVTIDGNETDAVDRNRLKIGNTEVAVAGSREEAVSDPDRYSIQVFNGAKVYFYKEDIFGDGNPAEVMEIDLTSSRQYGVGPAHYQNGKTVEAVRTLSYWTKYDMSKKNEAPRTSYGCKTILKPLQPYTKADVCKGIPIDEAGNPVTEGNAHPDGILAVNYVSVNAGQSTVAWMAAKENRSDAGPGGDLVITDNIKDILMRENKILLGDAAHTVTYTMNVLNHVANPSDIVQSENDRRYSIKDMVMINTLPYVGDRMPFDSRIPRDSAYGVTSDDFNVKLYYYDNTSDSDATADDRELIEMNSQYYTVLYSTKQTMTSSDWELTGKPDGWYTKEEFQQTYGDISQVRSLRIEIHDPTTRFDSSNPSAYRELMKAGRTVVAQYQAGAGNNQPSPGQCAWNSFGYRFCRFDGSAPMEASSIRTGVQIPAIPILYEKLIDYYQDPYVVKEEPQTFRFTIDKKEEEKTESDGTLRQYHAQQISFNVTVGVGDSEGKKELVRIGEDGFDISWVRQPDDTSDFWENGASYTVKQPEFPEEFPLFSVTVNDQPTSDFIYDASYEPVIIYKNQNKNWSSTLYKMDQASLGYDPTADSDQAYITFLPDAVFGLYTTDAGQKINLSELKPESGWKYTMYQRYQKQIDRMLEVSMGDGGEAATTLYMKDFGATDGDGRILWSDLTDDRYYVRELVAPAGFQIKNTYYQITKNSSILCVYNQPGEKLLTTGGSGTYPFYIIGSALLSVGAAFAGRRKKKR